MNIAIFGASGFLGKQLSASIIKNTDWQVTAIGRSPDKISIPPNNGGRFIVKQGDVTNEQSTTALLKDIDVAYYFVHMMGHKGVDFYEAELQAAEAFKRAANAAQLPRLIFMGGLGKNEAAQSKHLASRHRTGEILRSAQGRVIEFRASMIIGNGSVGFDIIRNTARVLPVMVLPGTANTHTQPIAQADAIAYLQAAATVHVTHNEVIDIGGPQVLSYADIYRRYATYAHRKVIVIKVPMIPAWLSSKALDILTPKIHARIGRAMVDSMTSEMVVESPRASQLFPDIQPMTIEQAFQETDRS